MLTLSRRQSVVAFIANELKATDNLAKISAAVLDQCLARGNKDNMTAVIIEFKDGTDYHRDTGNWYVPGPYHTGKDAKKFQEAYKADAEAAGYTLEEALRLLAENAKKKADEMLAATPAADKPAEKPADTGEAKAADPAPAAEVKAEATPLTEAPATNGSPQ